MYPARVASLAFCCAALLACATDHSADIAVAVRDSAGVQIVENPGDDAVLPRWQLEEPRVSIGVLEGEPAYQLDQVSGAMLHGGGLVVLNGGSQELRFFDLEGRHVRTVGRKGGGPGEFERATWLAPHLGDSIVVYDGRNRRISIFAGTGEFGRSVTPEFSFGTMVGRLSDGTYVVRPGISVSSSDNITMGLQRPPIGVVRVAEDGRVLDTLGVYPGTESIIDGNLSGENRWFSIRIRPFGLSTQVAASDSLVYVGTSEAWVIDVLDSAGTLRRSIRRTGAPPPITPEVIERYSSAQLAAITDETMRRESERFYASVDYPDHLPAYSALRLDHLGNLWVQDYVVSRQDSLQWTVFDPSGRIVSRIAMPPHMVVYEIGPDFVLGRIQDELEVQQVVVFGLSRSPSREIADADPR